MENDLQLTALVPPAPLRVMVLGAGAMGSLFGGMLAAHGVKVDLVDVNLPHIEAIRRQGLRLVTDQGEQLIEVRCLLPEEVDESPDLIILFTKGLHTESALKGIQAWIGSHTRILSLQNGLGNEQMIARFVDRAKIIIGITTYPADLRGPGYVVSHGEGVIRCMTLGIASDPYFDVVVNVLGQAGFTVEADPEVFSAIWEKVAFNAALNSLCAVLDVSVDRLGCHPSSKNMALQIAGEALSVADALDIPVNADKVEKTILHAIENHVGHYPSMLQDMRARRETEIESINGAIVAAAEGVGYQTPYNRALLELIRAKSALVRA